MSRGFIQIAYVYSNALHSMCYFISFTAQRTSQLPHSQV